MKSILKLLLFLTVGVSIGRAQTADDYVSQGRAFLAAHDLTNANSRFASAVALSPSHATGNVFRAATRLLMLPNQPAGAALLDRLGFSQTNRNVYDWTASVARDTNGVPLAPAGMAVSEVSAFLRTNALPEIIQAGANLAVVTGTNFTLALSSNETTSIAVKLDYGDILLLRAGLKFSEYLLYTTYSWNLDAQFTSVRSLLTDADVTTESFLRENTNLFQFATTNDLAAARSAFSNATVFYLEASEFIRNRPTNVTRLFNLDMEMTNSEARFRTTLSELKQSLSGPVVLTTDSNITVNAGNHFKGRVAPRTLLPQMHGNAIVAGTLPDPTFGDVIQGLPSYRVEDFLGHDKYFGSYPDDFYFRGIPFVSRFVTPQRLPDGRFLVTFDQLVGTYFIIQSSTDFMNWSDIALAASNHGRYSFIDDESGGGVKRFYRAVDVSGLFSLDGTVIDVSNGNPVQGATVLVWSPFDPGSPFFYTFSDASGIFFLILPIPLFDDYQVDVFAAGYSHAEFTGYAAGHVTRPVYLVPTGFRPPNDDFAQRQAIVGTNVSISGYNVAATAEVDEPDHAGISGGESVWWTWTSPVNGAVTIDTAGSSFAPALAVYTGSSISALSLVASDFESGGINTSTVNFFVTAGVSYQIAVDRAYYETSGRVVLNLRTTPPVPPTITYQPQSQVVLLGDWVEFYVWAYGTAPLFYQWEKDGIPLAGETNSYYYIANAQTNHAGGYTVIVSNALSSVVSSNAILAFPPPPSNDAFVNRIAIAGNSNSVTGHNISATKESGEPYHAGNPGGRSVWWTWTPSTNGIAIIKTDGSTFDTLLAVYTGSTITNLQLVATNNDAGLGTASWLSFNASAGVPYQIAVDGQGGVSGDVVLKLLLTASVPQYGDVVVWGSDEYNQTTVPVGMGRVVAIASDLSHCLALNNTGEVYGWGRNDNGSATGAPSNAPPWTGSGRVIVGGVPLTNAVRIDAGDYHSLALKSDGTVVQWGIGTIIAVPAGLSNVMAISAGRTHNLALKTDGTVIGWGANEFGQATGIPTTNWGSGPVQLQGNTLSNVMAVAAGWGHSVALRSNGTVVAWGRSGFNETNVPVGLSNVVAIASGGYHSLALRNDGRVFAWGYNIWGQCNVPSTLSDVIAIAGGEYHSLALKRGGTVVAWSSYNYQGQTSSPPNLQDVLSISAGYPCSMAIRRAQPIVAQ